MRIMFRPDVGTFFDWCTTAVVSPKPLPTEAVKLLNHSILSFFTSMFTFVPIDILLLDDVQHRLDND